MQRDVPAPPPPVVLLPGTLCDARLWSHQATHLAELTAVMVGDVTREDSVAGMARAVLATAPAHFALAGLSLGGIVAFEILRQAPERVAALALLDTNPAAPTRAQIEGWTRDMALVAGGGFDTFIRQRWATSLSQGASRRAGWLRAMVEVMAGAVGAEAYLRQMRAQIGRPDSRAFLPRIACPTLVLVGRQDAICPLEIHQAMAAAIPDARLVVVEECGHLSSLEQPESVTAALRTWILECVAGRPWLGRDDSTEAAHA